LTAGSPIVGEPLSELYVPEPGMLLLLLAPGGLMVLCRRR